MKPIHIGILIVLSMEIFLSPIRSADSDRSTEPVVDQRQTMIGGGLNLDDTIRLALNHNRSIQTILEEKTVSRGQIVEAYGYVLPVVNLEGLYTRLNEVPTRETDGEVVELGSLDNYSASLNVYQPVWHGGALSAGIRAAKLYRALSDENVRLVVERVIDTAIRSYFGVVLLEKQMGVQEEYLVLTREHLRDVKAKKRYGIASEFNVLRAEVEVSNAEAVLLQTRQSFHLAKHMLLKTIGVSQDSDIQLTDDLVFREFSIGADEAIEQALANRPDLAGAELTVKLQQESLNVAQGSYWPNLDAFFNYSLTRPDTYDPTLDEWTDGWRAGLSLKLDVFTLNRNGRVIQEKARLRQQKISSLDVREQAVYEIRSALSALADAAEFVETQKLTVTQANEGLRLAEVGYREGTMDQVAVLEARNALNQAKLLYWKSLFDHTMARLQIRKATGMLAPRIGSDQPETVRFDLEN
ncbi:TolC family protein [bacterium]|nr:TolC family protein [candidate division CSSED10-310 bacterium]